MDHFLPSNDLEIVSNRGQKSIISTVIEAIEFKFEVRNDLSGHMEAAIASEATKMANPGNMHINAGELRLLVSNLRSNLTSKATESIWRSPWPQRLP